MGTATSATPPLLQASTGLWNVAKLDTSWVDMDMHSTSDGRSVKAICPDKALETDMS